MKRKIAAILASDIAGYSRLVSEDEEDTIARFSGYRRAFEDFVTQHGGRVFNTAGDAILAEFPSAVEATRCAIDIQESMRTRNLGYAPSRQMLFRIGLTIGDVVERDGDLLGDGVNIAARLEGLAEPGGICVSRSIYEQVANKISVNFQDIGPREVKNLPQPIHAFRIPMGGDAGRDRSALALLDATPGRASKVRDIKNPAGLGAGIIMGALALLTGISALGVVLWREYSGPANIEARLPQLPQQRSPELPRELQSQPRVRTATPETPTPVESPSQMGRPEPAPLTPEVEPRQASKRPNAEEQAEKLAGLLGPVDPPAPPNVIPVKPVVLTPVEPPRATDPVLPPPVKPPAPPVQPPVLPKVEVPRPVVPAGASPADAFSIFSKAGGIIADAATAPELFHNARTWEARGEAANARTAYVKLAELGADFLDPHLRLAALLRAQDGRAGAREFYARLAEGKGGRVATLVHALQFDGPERRARIAALAGQHAQYGPVHMMLADEYAAERAGGETINERRAQFDALARFLEADRQGSLSQFFLDHSVLAEWLDRARARHQVLEQFLKTAKLEPSAQFVHANSGWMAHVWVPEAATRLVWRSNARSDFRSTGDSGTMDQRTGRPAPNLSFELPADIGEAVIELRYEDVNGETRGPFAIPFEPRTELVKSQRDILQRFSNNWITFGQSGPQAGLVYFTQLASYRCAITKVVLTFDDAPLPMQLRLPPCNPASPLNLPSDYKPFLSMPPSAKSVSVEITFADGAVSEKRKFERR